MCLWFGFFFACSNYVGLQQYDFSFWNFIYCGVPEESFTTKGGESTKLSDIDLYFLMKQFKI